ncbi:MAG: type III pantothenate kinase [Pirellulales bacterium]
MTPSSPASLMAVDVGNSRVKLGAFPFSHGDGLPHPQHTASLAPEWRDTEIMHGLPGDPADYTWAIASVNRPSANRLIEWLGRRGVDCVRQLALGDMPLRVDVAHPETVGVDRLANAVAVNRLRPAGQPALIVSHGTAITIDIVGADGSFRGGAILPGIHMAARALNEFTDRLPLVEVNDAPEVLERSTVGAIRFGLFWGAVGAIREVIARLPGGPDVQQIYLTGGAAPALAAVLDTRTGASWHFVPHLTLAGIGLAAEHAAAQEALKDSP